MMEDQISTLNEVIPALSLQMNDRKEWNFSGLGSTSGWTDVSNYSSAASNKFFAFSTKIDVSGWGNQALTFYPIQAGIQEGYVYNYLIDDSLRVIDLISDSPLDVGMFVADGASQFPNITVPSMGVLPTTDPANRILPPLGWENILYGNDRLFQHNNNLQGTLVLPVSSRDFGSMNPTATDRLYITRIISCETVDSAQTGGLCYIPPTRFIIKGKLMNESDLSYIYRLKDSFKTTQTDVGYNGL
tara:strand:+ start:145 stop:876 length:732 start_codon:yes stop_codon:yes gene_type:complete